ncbi:21581_t:CDS:2, partial [Dentiscutata erythropus]
FALSVINYNFNPKFVGSSLASTGDTTVLKDLPTRNNDVGKDFCNNIKGVRGKRGGRGSRGGRGGRGSRGSRGSRGCRGGKVSSGNRTQVVVDTRIIEGEELERACKELEEEMEKELNEETANSKCSEGDDNYESEEDIPIRKLRKRRRLNGTSSYDSKEDIPLRLLKERGKSKTPPHILLQHLLMTSLNLRLTKADEIRTEINDSDSTKEI